ncbi:helix-turn-helix domain-containing protein [Anaerolineales bacterium]
MTLETYIPCQPLSDYVEMFWYWEDYHPPHPRERILPGGMMEISISLSDVPFRINDGQCHTIRGSMAAGARSAPFLIDTAQAMSLLSVWFKPGGALPFFGVPGDKLHNLHLPLDTLWGLQANDLYDQLCEASSLIERFRLLEGALLARLYSADERHRAVHYALNIFRATPQAFKIKEVVEAIALSSTRFIDVFRQDVGMTPKQFCRIQRFQQSLALIAHQQPMNWVDVALNCGYYDQSHFINDFHSLAGITPSAYAPQSREHKSNLPVYDPG